MSRSPLAVRRIAPELMACLDRSNPRVRYHVELSAPDTSRVLRRWDDQFSVSPDPQVSLAPAASIAKSAQGGIQLTPTPATLATLTGETSFFSLNPEPTTLWLKSLRFTPLRTMTPCVLRSFTARVSRAGIPPSGIMMPSRFELQIYRATGTQGRLVSAGGVSTPRTNWTHTPLLSPAPLVAPTALTWTADRTLVTWDLSNFGLVLDASPPGSPLLSTEEENAYYFVVRAVDARMGDLFHWRLDTVSAHAVAGVGSFDRVWWGRSPAGEWVESVYGDVPYFKIEVDTYAPTATAVYLVTQGAVPLATSTGRIVFERSVPAGTTATVELSTAGAGGPFTVMAHGDAIATRQQTYHMRLTLNADAALRASPIVQALGVEWRAPNDVSLESRVDPPGMGGSAPFLAGAIGEGTLDVLRIGRRDYEDLGTTIGSRSAATALEADIWLMSDHPLVTRASWLHLSRASVGNREPGVLEERFTLLSYLSTLKRKIPDDVETINTVHTVQAAPAPTPNAITVSPVLVGTTAAGNEYDGQGHYLRVRTSAVAGAQGYVAAIEGNTNTTGLDFGTTSATAPLPFVLVAGDVVEVHSGKYVTSVLEYVDQDPAVVWWDLLAVKRGVPTERIGRAGLGPRSGLPPTVADICPGDATGQAKRTVTISIAEPEEVGQLVDQLSFLMGGITTEVAGQIVFRQIYSLRNTAGEVTVAAEPLMATFDPRDYSTLTASPGLDARATIVSCAYGVNLTAADPGSVSASRTRWIDADALSWLQQQDLDLRGTSEVPDEIARWCYNSTDAGLFLASEAARQVCLAASTGLRVWTWGSVDAYPELVPGDTVGIVTDQYTDYDPAAGASISGWVTVRAVLVDVRGDRRGFSGYVLGLGGNFTQEQGGRAGVLAGVDMASVAVPAIAYAAIKTGDARGWTAYVQASFTAPATPFFDHMEYSVESRAVGAASWNDPVLVTGSRTGPDLLPATFNSEMRVTPVTVSSGGTRTSGAVSSAILVGDNPAAEVVSISTVRGALYIDFTITVDSDFAYGVAYFEERTTDPVTAPDVSGPTKTISASFNRKQLTGSTITLRGVLSASTKYGCMTVLPFDANSRQGDMRSAYAQGNAAATAPNAPLSAAMQSVTGTSVTIRATMTTPIGSPVPDTLRLYRGGVLRASLAITPSDGSTHDITETGLLPSTTYTHEVANVAATIESTTRTAAAAATTSAITLDAPTLSGTRAGTRVTLTWTAGANNPSDRTFDIESNTGAGYTVIDVDQTGLSYVDISAVGTLYRVIARRPPYTVSAYSNVVTP